MKNELRAWLFLCRGIVSGNAVINPVSRITSNRPFIRFVLYAAVVVYITAWVSFVVVVENRSSPDPSFALQEVGVNTSLVTTVLLVVQTAFQLLGERAALGKLPPSLS